METSFEISGGPVPASRPRVARNGGVFYPKAHTARAEDLRKELKETTDHPTVGPVELRILSVMPAYKTSDYPTHRSDVDNLAKLPMDSMTTSKRYWKDDNLVCVLSSMKRFARDGEEPHTKIKIVDIVGSVEDYVDERFET